MDIVNVVAVAVAAAAVVVAFLALKASRTQGETPALAQTAARTNQAVEDTRHALDELDRRREHDASAAAASIAQVLGALTTQSRQIEALRTDVTGQLSRDRDAQDRRLAALSGAVTEQLGQTSKVLNDQLAATNKTVVAQLSQVRGDVGKHLDDIRSDNNRQLDAMRATVNEKLERTLNDRLSASFNQINEQLEAVHRGLGTMQSLASNVGDLRRVLSNVKTRGILGEVQLGAILAQILSPEQYETDVATKPGSTERVEFAVRVPVEGGDPILLPIDAKFPGDTYRALLDAQEAGDREEVRRARKALENRIRAEAKDIATKYVAVPATTNFAIMFLPFEGLYAEVVSIPGLIERLQRDHGVNVAGPSTMAALLNSLQLSYQTFALQRQTDQVMRVLQSVKAELPKYQEALRTAKRRIDSAGNAVDQIITTRTNVMERALRDVTLDGGTVPELELEGEIVVEDGE